jgi:hypothetical protein
MKLIVKLVIVALIANAVWHLMTAYTAHYRFKDAIEESATYGIDLSDEQLRQRVVDLMAQFDIPADASSFDLRREDKHTVIDGSYTRIVDLLPGYSRSWPFSWHVDTYTIKPTNLKELTSK